MYLASKFEEVYAPNATDFARSTDNGYVREEIIEMENILLKTLNWKLSPVTSNYWTCVLMK
jgi:hypothetical protein